MQPDSDNRFGQAAGGAVRTPNTSKLSKYHEIRLAKRSYSRITPNFIQLLLISMQLEDETTLIMVLLLNFNGFLRA